MLPAVEGESEMLNRQEVPSLYSLLPRGLNDTREAEGEPDPSFLRALSPFLILSHLFTPSRVQQ